MGLGISKEYGEYAEGMNVDTHRFDVLPGDSMEIVKHKVLYNQACDRIDDGLSGDCAVSSSLDSISDAYTVPREFKAIANEYKKRSQ